MPDESDVWCFTHHCPQTKWYKPHVFAIRFTAKSPDMPPQVVWVWHSFNCHRELKHFRRFDQAIAHATRSCEINS